jgi:hypothetical protein
MDLKACFILPIHSVLSFAVSDVTADLQHVAWLANTYHLPVLGKIVAPATNEAILTPLSQREVDL